MASYYNQYSNPIPKEAKPISAKIQRRALKNIVKKLRMMRTSFEQGNFRDYFDSNVEYDEVGLRRIVEDFEEVYGGFYQAVMNRPYNWDSSYTLIRGALEEHKELFLEQIAKVIWQSMINADPSYGDDDPQYRRFLEYIYGTFMQYPFAYMEDYRQFKTDIQAMYDEQMKDDSLEWSQWVPKAGQRNEVPSTGLPPGTFRETLMDEERFPIPYAPGGTEAIEGSAFFNLAMKQQEKGNCVILMSNDQFMFIDILTDEGACTLGAETSWCTLSGMSQTQKENGVIMLYVYKNGRRLQFDIEGREEKNENNVTYTNVSRDVKVFGAIMDAYSEDIRDIVRARIDITKGLTPITDFLNGNDNSVILKFENALSNLKQKMPPKTYIGTTKMMKVLPIFWLSKPQNRQLVERIFNNQSLLTEKNFNMLAQNIDYRILKVEFAVRRSPFICKFLQNYPTKNWFKDPKRPSEFVQWKEPDLDYPEDMVTKSKYVAQKGAKLDYKMNLFALAPVPGGRHAFQDEHVWVDPFEIMKYEMTRGVYLTIMGFDAQGSWTDYDEFNLPKSEVNWYEACACANRFSELCGYQGVYYTKRDLLYSPSNAANNDEPVWDHNAEGFRLPTEAEWEIAARGGDESRVGQENDFAGSANPLEVAWFSDNSNNKVHGVGQLKPNGYGLFDMSGNVYEWVWDTYGGERVSYPLKDPKVAAAYAKFEKKQNPRRRRNRNK